MTEPLRLTRTIVEAIHADQVLAHGGRPGLRDQGLLESALARARQRWSYEPGADLASLAASYGFGLTRNHPFLDGNKRIGFVAMNVFLILNGYEVETAEPEVVATMLGVADGRLDEAGLARWLRGVIVPCPA